MVSPVFTYGCKSWTIEKAEVEELMLLNCGVGEDSWCWSANTLATWCEELTHWERPWGGEDWGREEKGMTEDEMVGWNHRAAVYEVAKSRTWLRDWTKTTINKEFSNTWCKTLLQNILILTYINILPHVQRENRLLKSLY